MLSTAQLTQSLKAESKRLGFQLSGACRAVEPSGIARFHEWLDNGYAGEMHYLEGRKEAYEHPRHVMDGAISLLLLGLNYQSVAPKPTGKGQGRIARYAWGDADYHDLIHGKLKSLCKFTRELNSEFNVRGVVDTAPLLEREFAQLAGLGWAAKNTLLINKKQGSWFLLAALLLDQELEYDQPVETNHCGTCTACMTACPTDAFPQPHVLDANRCISYLTIEHRSPIPIELRPQMGDWLFGCDVCQEVCPWNNKSGFTEEEVFAPLDGNNPVELRPLFSINDDEFRARFRKTPLWRSKRRGILRNAAIVLGNSPHDENLPALTLGLNDVEPLIRGASAWALGQHRAGGVLRARMAIEDDGEVAAEIALALTEAER